MPEPRQAQLAGVVVIGRNEGERLRRCLASLAGQAPHVVYVDSGSSDGSAGAAKTLGADVVGLDMAVPFTAARARNAGYQRLRALAPHLRYVQFVDGDCEVVSGWMEAAVAYLEANRSTAVVCGRRRELHPEETVYNLLCDIEWDQPPGSTLACGGDALMRVEAFEGVGGFRADMIAGEEPELCVRLRAAGWQIWRLPRDMTLHDAAIKRFAQWWKRSVRAGYAFAHGAALHGDAPERHWVRESRRIWLWALWIPAGSLLCAALAWPAGLAAFAVYPLQVVRLVLRGTRPGRENWWQAFFLVLGKFPEMVGQARFLAGRLAGRRSALIEYK